MMTASRQVDGVAKLLGKADIERLKAPTVKPKLLEAEPLASTDFSSVLSNTSTT